ncbi:MAG TPA: hypothetical protein VMI54_28410 [Polyangiaceae bacterium]|nr:hypothetical protein [Polyangiaceae bacterium]
MSTAVAEPRRARLPAAATLRTGIALAIALLALVFSKLALPAALFVFLSFLAAPVAPPSVKQRHRAALLVAAIASGVAVPLFLVREAVPGLVQGGTGAASQRAVSRLREFEFAEDAARRTGSLDPDGDKVGSALLLGELTGEIGMRHGARLAPPLLENYPALEGIHDGRAVEIGGFWFTICLPVTGGGFSSDPDAHFDDEAAERRYVAYAWPSGRAPGLDRAYFLDEHENILAADAEAPDLRFGAEHPPACDDAVAPATRDAWRPWRGKKPRASLPGDAPLAKH